MFHEGDVTRSSLFVYNATDKDSGKYTCQPSNAKNVSVVVHVIKSKYRFHSYNPIGNYCLIPN